MGPAGPAHLCLSCWSGCVPWYLRTLARHCSLVAPPTSNPTGPLPPVSRPDSTYAQLTRPKLGFGPVPSGRSIIFCSPTYIQPFTLGPLEDQAIYYLDT